MKMTPITLHVFGYVLIVLWLLDIFLALFKQRFSPFEIVTASRHSVLMLFLFIFPNLIRINASSFAIRRDSFYLQTKKDRCYQSNCKLEVYNINSSLIQGYKVAIITMLISKKLKPIEEKPKSKGIDSHVKKVKKQKISSPNKLRVTPEKKKRRDENCQIGKVNTASVQQSEYYKSKQSQRPSNLHKKSQNRDNKSKLLTTSPIHLENSKSRSKQKTKSKSKSVSRLNTYRSTYEKEINKSVTKKLFEQIKDNKSRSKEKSKSKSRLKTDRDVSPLKEIKQVKRFNVADREIGYNKNETSELKKTLKKKIQNTRSKAEPFLYPTEPIDEVIQIEVPKIKLKKKVPQIKTEFSERRGSYFDENLLKKLQINHQQGKKAELCPFMHIKSNFEERFKENVSIYSKSELKNLGEVEAPQQSFTPRNEQVEVFKREQERRWNLMLSQLKNLKNQPKVAERIDVLIEYLNQNYVSLQEKVIQISGKQNKSIESLPLNQVFDSIIHESQKSMAEEQLSLLNHFNFDQLHKQAEKDINELVQQKVSSLKEIKAENSNSSSLKFLSPIPVQNVHKSQQPSSQNNEVKQQPNLAKDERIEQNDLAFKRSNNINLSEFYQFMEKNENERKVQFSPFLKMTTEDIANYSAQIIQDEISHKMSDKNLLNDLNILENSEDFLEILPAFKEKTSEFKQEMEKIRRNQHEIDADEDFGHNFHNEVRMNEEMSSQSMLLNMNDNVNKREKLVDEVQQALLLQFCITILRSKSILNNFITTYSELVESNAIKAEVGFSEARNAGQYSNQYVRSVILRLVNHIEVNYKQNFLNQVKLPFQCKIIEILKFIRSSQEEIFENSIISNEENPLQVPYFNEKMIEEFETEVLKNQYFFPGYFSFNHCIYDEFNDIFEELRPYGSQGKTLFSLELSHPITKFQVAKQTLLERVEKHLEVKYPRQDNIPDEKYPNEEGVFQLLYFTNLDVVEMIFEQEALEIAKTIDRSNRKKFAC